MGPTQLFEKQVRGLAKSFFYHLHLDRKLSLCLDSWPGHNKPCLCNITTGLLWCTLDWSALEVNLEISNGSECKRVITVGAGWWEQIVPILNELHWPPVCLWVQFKVWVKRSLDCSLVADPPLKVSHQALNKAHTYSIITSTLWNFLPEVVKWGYHLQKVFRSTARLFYLSAYS